MTYTYLLGPEIRNTELRGEVRQHRPQFMREQALGKASTHVGSYSWLYRSLQWGGAEVWWCSVALVLAPVWVWWAVWLNGPAPASCVVCRLPPNARRRICLIPVGLLGGDVLEKTANSTALNSICARFSCFDDDWGG